MPHEPPASRGAKDERRPPDRSFVPRARRSLARIALVAAVAIGVALRVAQYAAHRSLWLDEAALAANIIHRSFAALARPLDFAQVAPLGFLWLEKGIITLFGASEWTLRLLPFLAALASVPLMAVLARRLLGGTGAVVATTLFAVSSPLLYFAAETKQYATDAAIAIVILLFALRWRDREIGRRGAVAAGIAGALAPWVSQPSAFVLAAAAIFLAAHAERGRRRERIAPLAIAFSLWAIGAALALGESIRTVTPAVEAYLQVYWANSFLPLAAGLIASAAWIRDLATEIAAWLFPLPWAWGALALSAAGIVVLARRRDGALWLVVGPLLFALVASALHLYPVAPRLTLFAAPMVMLAAGAGADGLVRLGARLAPPWREPARVAAAGLLALLLVECVRAAVHTPRVREELRPVVRYLAAHRRPGDAIYVYYGAARAFEFYAPRAGIPRDAYVLGRCSRSDWRGYLADLDAERGKPRVWLVLSHPFHRAGIQEDSLVLGYLGRLGRPVARDTATGALVALYDLSDTTRAARLAPAFSPPQSHDSSGVRERCAGPLTIAAPTSRGGRTYSSR